MDVSSSGPILDGTAVGIVGGFIDDAVYALATHGIAEVQTNLNESIRFPTPYYETQVNIRQNRGGTTVNDRGVIYGHWLEGDSKMNKRSRFKGYWSFRRAQQFLERNADRLIQAQISAMMRRLNS